MPRKRKITTDEGDRKDQRDATEALKESLQDANQLPETAPRHLTSEAKKLWEKLVPVLNDTGYIIDVDSSTVETLVINYAMLREAYESIKKNKVVYEIDGKIYKNPAVAIVDSTTKIIKSVGSDLGLSPQSRATLIDMAKVEEDDEGQDYAERFGADR
ncbi:possible phage terminase small subunit [Weissella oryzae SG25]|uniref:Possible phage terminase small subunit n=1 Tax=Weissella oryzae (strain DSM 25784 / JCM 18191 / LMG 30913 / SG25) TaxID=1329250 RepID=A0A069CS15_WEIOS|nr:phage terminase small subunit P27 family [Weissella oryzae]GAK30209.1 possible phage terminase small subunit [Weissella oryzae SG25]